MSKCRPRKRSWWSRFKRWFRGLFAVALIAGTGCAPGADGWRQSIGNGAASITSASVLLHDVDEIAKAKILFDVEVVCSRAQSPKVCAVDEGQKRFDNLVAKRSVAVMAIKGANIVVKGAADILPAVEAGIESKDKLMGWLVQLPRVLAALSQAVADLALLGEK